MNDIGTGIFVYAVAAVVTVVLARWLFSKRSGTTSSHSLPGNTEERIAILQEMFPHLPNISIRDALERTNFVIDDAVSFLLSTAIQHPPVVSRSNNIQEPPKEGAVKNQLTRSIADVELNDSIDPASLNQWTEDPIQRQRLLALKKRMLVENARKQIVLHSKQ